ncbi:MAG TPA: transcription termination factor Rho [Chthoniobacteraceae bacterium]|jgi:transcription termination factor Rho|nr:transcription termination factor Rho [Chthoniobacteraceae bacterium]
MTEPAEHSLLEEQPAEKTTKRRAPAAKRAPARSRVRAAAAPAAGAPETPPAAETTESAAPAKPRTRKPAARKTAAPSVVEEPPGAPEPTPAPAAAVEPAASAPVEAMLPGMDVPAPRAPRRPAARKPKSAPAKNPPLVSTGEVEEWSPSRPSTPAPASAAPSTNGAGAHHAPEPPRVPERPAAEQAPVESAPAPVPPPARKYPVYIPRHVAKQMEEQGQTAPIAVPADAVPEVARAAVEAVRLAQAERLAQQAAAREARADRGADRPDRHERPERGGRPDRNQRGQREERPDRREQALAEDENRQLPEPGPDEELGTAEGMVEISGKGFGFIRDPKRGYAQHPSDVFVTPEIVRKYNLRDGQWLNGETRRGGRGAQLHRLTAVNGDEPDKARTLPAFEELTVVSPMERLEMETTPERSTTRLIDLFTPIGKGQRGLIVAPPRTGKTTLLQHIAEAMLKKHPEVTLIVLLVDERPEEVTDLKRTLPGAEIMASSNDSDVKSHTRIAQLAIERARRLVESGKDVFVLLDSITRVGRAFNNAMAGGGRTMSGGVDSRALEIPRRLFASARNTEEAGSLTIIATALIETGSRMDELIFQEFKGTGNMEIVLDRKISDQRIYPAIDMFQSGTRREELLIPADDLHKIAVLRRGLAGHKPMEAIERLLFFLKKFPTNAQMLREIPG